MPVELDQPSKCTPMKGYLTLYSRSGNRRWTHQDTTVDRNTTNDTADQSALAAIEDYMNSARYLSDNVLKVSYIGKRDLVPVGIINPAILVRPGNRKLDLERATSNVGSSTGVAMCGVLVAVCAVVGRLAKRIKVLKRTDVSTRRERNDIQVVKDCN